MWEEWSVLGAELTVDEQDGQNALYVGSVAQSNATILYHFL